MPTYVCSYVDRALTLGDWTRRIEPRRPSIVQKLRSTQCPVARDIQVDIKPACTEQSNDQAMEEKTNSRRKMDSAARNGLRSVESEELAKSKKLEDQINLHHLIALMKIFDEGNEKGLDINEFRAAFNKILGKETNDEQITIMFKKIDTNCHGTIHWDVFCTYMLMEYQEKDDTITVDEELKPYPYPLRIFDSLTHGTVSKITYLPALQRYHASNPAAEEKPGSSSCDDTVNRCNRGNIDGRFLSVSRDGALSTWNSDLTLQRAISINHTKSWVTDLVVLPNINKLILSFTDDTVILYDHVTASCDVQCQIIGFPATVVHMHYWFDPKQLNYAVLVFGDTGGGILTMEFSNITNCVFGWSASHQMSSQTITFSDLLHKKHDGLSVHYSPHLHSDWISQVKYSPSLLYVMSSSGDDNNSLCLADLHGRKSASVLKVKKGITSFDYCKQWNIIGAGGLDRHVRYWNPYVPGKPIAILKGHSTAVLKVAIHSAKGLVISLAKDFELRVWSIARQICIQSCNKCKPLLPYTPSAFYLHPQTGNILVATNQIASLKSSYYEQQVADATARRDIVSHEQPICAALYNKIFNQVVSGCHGSVVKVWDIDTGEKIIQFSQCHGKMEITAMAFDRTGRKLITGGKDGSIKIWNFNNGACLSVLESRYKVEVTTIICKNQRLVVGGWNRCLAVYGDTGEPDDVVPKYWAFGVHKEDILCMACEESTTLASASYDGNIAIWNLDMDRLICKLNRRNYKQSGSRVAFHSQTYPSTKSNEAKASCNKYTVEKLLFLTTRKEGNKSSQSFSATLIACGACGMVNMWNHHGGGLIGEFNIWDNSRHTIPEHTRCLESITAMQVDSKDSLLITGNSLGYIQMWSISTYCVHVPQSQRPIQTSPENTIAWQAHSSSVVSIDLVEEKCLLITASTDRSICVWTLNGRYIGTFGEKSPWTLAFPIKDADLPRKLPSGISRRTSFKTMHTVSGPFVSKWKIARNLLSLLRQSKQRQEALESQNKTENNSDEGLYQIGTNILGKYYETKRQLKEPIKPKHLRIVDGKLTGVYQTLRCHDMSKTIEKEMNLKCPEGIIDQKLNFSTAIPSTSPQFEN